MLVVVDPVSTGRCLAIEAARRGHQALALWSTASSDRERDVAAFAAEVDVKPSLDLTVDTLCSVGRCSPTQLLVLPGGDDGVPLADALSARVGRPIAAAAACFNRRAKHEQQRQATLAGLRACRTAVGTRWGPEMAEVCAHSAPVVVKLAEGTGSEGVRLCASAADAQQHVEWLLANQKPAAVTPGAIAVAAGSSCSVVVQEYLSGGEYVVDSVTRGGVHKIVMLWEYDKRQANGVDFVYFGERPLPPDAPEAARLVPYALRVLDAVGVLEGPAHTELVLQTAEGGAPCLIEANLRCHGGSGLWVSLVERLVNYSQVSATIDGCFEPHRFDALPPLPPVPLRGAGAFLCLVNYAHGRGIVRGVPGFEAIRRLDSFLDLNPMSVTCGAWVAPTVDLSTLVGMAVLYHTSAETVASDVTAVRKLEASGTLLQLDAAAALDGSSSQQQSQHRQGGVRRRKIGFAKATSAPATA